MTQDWPTRISLFLLLLWGANFQVLADPLSISLKAETPVTLARDARSQGSTVRGAILFADQELACASCHAQGTNDGVGPDLTNLQDGATDSQLVESILWPSRVLRKGFQLHTIILTDGRTLQARIVRETATEIVARAIAAPTQTQAIRRDQVDRLNASNLSSMPDNLVDQLDDRQQFLDLLRYVMHLRDQPAQRPQPAMVAKQALSPKLRGRVLIEQYHCAACHHDLRMEAGFATPTAPLLAEVGRRIDPDFLREYIEDPQHTVSGTAMPNLLASHSNPTQIATEITHYLISRSEKPFHRKPLDQVSARRGETLFESIGCLACHSGPRQTNTGSERRALGHVARKYSLDSLTAFLEAPHDVRPTGRMPDMQLSHWEAMDIANYLLQGQPDPTAFEIDHQKAAEGRSHFTKLGCNRCHEMPDSDQATNSISSVAAIQNLNAGCLSGSNGSWPQYRLDLTSKAALVAAIQSTRHPNTEEERIQLTLARFNCIACHERAGWGGAGEADSHFQTTNPNIGPQGRIPPTLTGIGAKLNPKWMRQVLVQGRSIRPYMLTRMPQFGASNVEHLVDLFAEVDRDGLVPFEPTTGPDDKAMRTAGHELVSRDGLNCIACHTFQYKPAATMPAVDLTEMTDRLQKNWFQHYLRTPQRLSPGTVMPSFWPNGHAIRSDVLAGNTSLQIDAIWRYLADGRQARTPGGLVRQRMELLAGEEAVMLRRSWPDVGKRGIGVGYPKGVNLVFDAEQMRLAMIWHGRFADPGGVWRSQGHGVVHPLERIQYRFAKGPDLDDTQQPWLTDDARPPQHQFLGYDLDALQRPAFRYRFENVNVVDSFLDEAENDRTTLARTVTFTTTQPRHGLRFRVASGEKIAPTAQGYRLGEHWEIQVPDHAGSLVFTAGEVKQLNILLDLPSGSSNVQVNYRWVGTSK